MNVPRCCDALPQLSYHLQFWQIFIAATSHSLSALDSLACSSVSDCGPHSRVMTKIGRGTKANYFLRGRHLFQASLEFAYSDRNEICCKTAVIIGTFSSGTRLERKSLCVCVCTCLQIWIYVWLCLSVYLPVSALGPVLHKRLSPAALWKEMWMGTIKED